MDSPESNGNEPQVRGLVEAAAMLFACGVSIGRTINEADEESALLVISGNFGGDPEVVTLHIAIDLESWPTFAHMVSRFEEVGKPPTPGDDI